MESQKAPKSCILIYGTIELGWLLQFIGRARHKAEAYNRVVVHCEEPFKYLYEDFAHEIVMCPVQKAKKDRWLVNGGAPKYTDDVRRLHLRLMREHGQGKLFFPTEDRCKRKEAKWVKYGQEGMGVEKYDILIHARGLPINGYDKRIVRGSRNWPNERWASVVGHFSGKKVACIGSPAGSRHIFGTVDLRGIDLKVLCNTMARAKVIVGESSGPLHLASLCGLPQVVITHNHKERSLGTKTNRDRYEWMWNPLGTKCTVLDHDNWNPHPNTVISAVEKYL